MSHVSFYTLHKNIEKNTFQAQLNTKLIISDGMKTKVTGFENDGRIGHGEVQRIFNDMIHNKHVQIEF